jgi:hypothetical protein
MTPVLTHPYNWNKVSVAGALGYRLRRSPKVDHPCY